MPVRPEHTVELTALLSAERLGSLMQLTGSPQAAISIHQETLRVGALLMNVTATIEIALRNAVAANLTNHFGVPNWLQQPPVAFTWRKPERDKISQAVDSAKRAEYSKLSQAEKAALDVIAYPVGRPANTAHLKRAKDRRNHLVITEGKVIAELSLYFWKRLYSPEYEQSLWRTSLKRTFPDKTLSRAEVATQLEHFYQSRNRLAHHEPVLHQRFADTVTAIDFIAQRLGATKADPNGPLATLLSEDILAVRESEAALRSRLDAFRK